MFGLSFGHILLFGIIVLVFVGPEQLPEVARNLARLINELRRTTRDFQNQFTGDFNMRQPWDQPLPKPPTSVPQTSATAEAPVASTPATSHEPAVSHEPVTSLETASPQEATPAESRPVSDETKKS